MLLKSSYRLSLFDFSTEATIVGVNKKFRIFAGGKG